MLKVVCESNWRLSDAEVDALVDPGVQSCIRIGVQTVRKATGRQLMECEGGDSFFG